MEAIISKILSDHFIFFILICLFAGAGINSIYRDWVNRNNPDLAMLAEAVKSFAEMLANKQESENEVMKKLLDMVAAKEEGGKNVRKS